MAAFENLSVLRLQELSLDRLLDLQVLLGCFWEGFVGSGVCSLSGQDRRFGSNPRVFALRVHGSGFAGFEFRVSCFSHRSLCRKHWVRSSVGRRFKFCNTMQVEGVRQGDVQRAGGAQ